MKLFCRKPRIKFKKLPLSREEMIQVLEFVLYVRTDYADSDMYIESEVGLCQDIIWAAGMHFNFSKPLRIKKVEKIVPVFNIENVAVICGLYDLPLPTRVRTKLWWSKYDKKTRTTVIEKLIEQLKDGL